MSTVGNNYSIGQIVVVNRDSLQFKATVVGFAKKLWDTLPSKYTLELSNGDKIVVDESELSPHVVSKHIHAVSYIATLIAMMVIIIIVATN